MRGGRFRIPHDFRSGPLRLRCSTVYHVAFVDFALLLPIPPTLLFDFVWSFVVLGWYVYQFVCTFTFACTSPFAFIPFDHCVTVCALFAFCSPHTVRSVDPLVRSRSVWFVFVTFRFAFGWFAFVPVTFLVWFVVCSVVCCDSFTFVVVTLHLFVDGWHVYFVCLLLNSVVVYIFHILLRFVWSLLLFCCSDYHSLIYFRCYRLLFIPVLRWFVTVVLIRFVVVVVFALRYFIRCLHLFRLFPFIPRCCLRVLFDLLFVDVSVCLLLFVIFYSYHYVVFIYRCCCLFVVDILFVCSGVVPDPVVVCLSPLHCSNLLTLFVRCSVWFPLLFCLLLLLFSVVGDYLLFIHVDFILRPVYVCLRLIPDPFVYTLRSPFLFFVRSLFCHRYRSSLRCCLSFYVFCSFASFVTFVVLPFITVPRSFTYVLFYVLGRCLFCLLRWSLVISRFVHVYVLRSVWLRSTVYRFARLRFRSRFLIPFWLIVCTLVGPGWFTFILPRCLRFTFVCDFLFGRLRWVHVRFAFAFASLVYVLRLRFRWTVPFAFWSSASFPTFLVPFVPCVFVTFVLHILYRLFSTYVCVPVDFSLLLFVGVRLFVVVVR